MTERIKTTCAIAGGGPAGLMLGYLLARAGLGVVVLEKHADFLRDFRGDTVHPSTMQALADLGDLEAFLALPHARFARMTLDFEGREVTVADFSRLGMPANFVAMMPQWDFLDFLAGRARTLPGFALRMRTAARGLLREGGRVVGLQAEGPDGPVELRAALTVAADGRDSRLREAAGLPVQAFGSPIDVLWFRLSRQPGDAEESLGRVRGGRLFVMLNRGDFWQCAHVVPKGGAEAIRAAGIAAFRARVDGAMPFDPPRGAELATWDDVKLLEVQVNRLERWWAPGLLAIGDAAHAMSPIGGVGVNLAVQDAVAAANLLWRPLKDGRLAEADLARVQARRERPVRLVQRVQVLAQNRVIAPVIAGGDRRMPLPFRLIDAVPALARLPAWFIGRGPAMERVDPALRGD